MFAFLVMNASDSLLVAMNSPHYSVPFSSPISQYFVPLFSELSETNLIILERVCWWLHIVGILVFLNYLVISKHLHFILAFPDCRYCTYPFWR